MANDQKPEPLYERIYGTGIEPYTYKCNATGQVCKRVTEYFQDYAAFVKRMSDENSNRVFIHGEPNMCCEPMYCPIYEKAVIDKKVAEFEKTLPAIYMHYKQQVEQYRESLMQGKKK